MKNALDELMPPPEQARVVEAVRKAEASTSGQIKVHVEPSCRGTALERARSLFASLGLTRTRQRNAVLIYVAPRDRTFAIVGDDGIHGVGGDDLWQRAAAAMKAGLGSGSLADGLLAAVAEVGAVLAREFPPQAGQHDNELSDEISRGPDDGAGAVGKP